MPFGSIANPSIGISLLAEGLRRSGVQCDVHYLNLRFAARIGTTNYAEISNRSPMTALAGEWLFRSSLFGGDCSESDWDYVKQVLMKDFSGYFTPNVLLQLFDVRDEVGAFLDECVRSIDWSIYSLVGFSTTFQQNVASLALAKRLKQARQDLIIVFGGANCGAEMGAALHRNFRFIDFVCSGEGDRAFLALVRALDKGESPIQTIDGIVSRSGSDTILPRRIVWPIQDLDELPYPSYDDYFDQLRQTGLDQVIKPLTPFETSRGCWWGAKNHCTFCGLNGQTLSYRSKSQDRAFHEVLSLADRYGKNIVCVDNIFDLHYLQSFFPKLAEAKRGLSFYFDTKVNLTKGQMRVLRQAGVTHLEPGIESLSTHVLQLMRKGCDTLQNIRCLRWAKQYNITVEWNILYGFPGEDPADYAAMASLIPYLHHLEPPIYVSNIRMDRHSPYFNNPGAFGLSNLRPYPAYAYVYALPERELFDLAYYFKFDYPQGQRVDEYVGEVLAQAREWQAQSGKGVTLLARGLANGNTIITDSRKIACHGEYELPELAWLVLQGCDDVVSLRGLCRKLQDRYPADRIESTARELCDRHLLFQEGKRIVSLAVIADGNFADATCRDKS